MKAEEDGHTESSLEQMGNKTSMPVPIKAHSAIEPGAGPKIPGPLAVLFLPKMTGCTCVCSICYPCQLTLDR